MRVYEADSGGSRSTRLGESTVGGSAPPPSSGLLDETMGDPTWRPLHLTEQPPRLRAGSAGLACRGITIWTEKWPSKEAAFSAKVGMPLRLALPRPLPGSFSTPGSCRSTNWPPGPTPTSRSTRCGSSGGRTLAGAVEAYHVKLGAQGRADPLESAGPSTAFAAVCHTIAHAYSHGILHRT